MAVILDKVAHQTPAERVRSTWQKVLVPSGPLLFLFGFVLSFQRLVFTSVRVFCMFSRLFWCFDASVVWLHVFTYGNECNGVNSGSQWRGDGFGDTHTVMFPCHRLCVSVRCTQPHCGCSQHCFYAHSRLSCLSAVFAGCSPRVAPPLGLLGFAALPHTLTHSLTHSLTHTHTIGLPRARLRGVYLLL